MQCYSQNFEMKIDSVIKHKIEYLKKENNEKIGYTKLSCIGHWPSSTAYLFWTKDNQFYLQKFEDGSLLKSPVKYYKPIQINDSIFFNFYLTNENQLKKERIERYKTKKDSIVGDKIYSSVRTISHSCFRNFIIFKNSEFENYNFNFFNLRKYHDKTRTDRNLSYESNIRTKLVEWDKLITRFIEKIESENDFTELKTD